MDSRLFRNKYRISSARLKNWNYTNGGYYFVTVCTQNKEHFFGEINDNKLKFSEISKIVKQKWKEIPEHFPHVKLDKFVIMPNHIHGLIFINEELLFANVEARYSVSHNFNNKSMSHESKTNVSQFSKPIRGSLSVIINRFKGSVKRQCNKDGHKCFHWQKLFHDRIIRNEKELYNVRKYIENNPINWINDEYF